MSFVCKRRDVQQEIEGNEMATRCSFHQMNVQSTTKNSFTRKGGLPDKGSHTWGSKLMKSGVIR